MAYIILDSEGEPLEDFDGKLILVATEAEAREWVRPSDLGVMKWERWVELQEPGEV